uniref:Major facilitator superfamily (MFS) profile domain-containing protein n=1 Tax=Cuerna arida TaxID=1464854 RepID=A0A1B6FT38_9HEMI
MAPKCVSRGLLNQYIAGLAACLSVVNSATCFGWVTPIFSHLLGPDSEIPMNSVEAAWAVSIIELGNLVSPLPAGILTNYVGRKPVLLAAGPMYIISWLMIIYYPTVLMLVAARIVQGIAMGLVYTAGPIYLGEIASKTTRGTISSIFFNSWWLGFLIEYAVGPYLTFYPFTYFTLLLNIPFLLLFCWQPDSPYFYLMNGEEEKARKSLKWFRDATPEELQEEMEEIKMSVLDLKKSSSVSDIVATPEERKALTILMVLSAVRLLSGTGAITVYATDIFNLTPKLVFPSDKVTIVLGIVLFVGGCISSLTSDSIGRRPLLMVSCVGTLLCQVCTGTYYYVLTNTSLDVAEYSWIAAVLIIVYCGLCTSGMYPVCSAYTSELFSSNTRGIASSLSAINVTIASFLILVIYQPITDYIGLYANFYFYSIIIASGGLYFYFYAPETKGKSFLQIKRELASLYS